MKQLDGVRCLACVGGLLRHWLPADNFFQRIHVPFGDVFLFFCSEWLSYYAHSVLRRRFDRISFQRLKRRV